MTYDNLIFFLLLLITMLICFVVGLFIGTKTCTMGKKEKAQIKELNEKEEAEIRKRKREMLNFMTYNGEPQNIDT